MGSGVGQRCPAQELYFVEAEDGSKRFAASAAELPPGSSATSPVQAGIVTNWAAAWAHIDRAVGRVEGKRLMVVDNTLAPRSSRERWAKEAFGSRGFVGISFVRGPVALW